MKKNFTVRQIWLCYLFDTRTEVTDQDYKIVQRKKFY